MLVMFSGLPGCGKTSLARRAARWFHLPLFAKDRIQAYLRARGMASRSGPEGYQLLIDLADEQLGLGVGVILDGVFPLAGFRDQARKIASRHAAIFRPVFCHCSDEALWRSRMPQRQAFVPNWTPVGWDEVERLQSIFEPWDSDKALSLDAVEDLEANFRSLVRFLSAAPGEN